MARRGAWSPTLRTKLVSTHSPAPPPGTARAARPVRQEERQEKRQVAHYNAVPYSLIGQKRRFFSRVRRYRSGSELWATVIRSLQMTVAGKSFPARKYAKCVPRGKRHWIPTCVGMTKAEACVGVTENECLHENETRGIVRHFATLAFHYFSVLAFLRLAVLAFRVSAFCLCRRPLAAQDVRPALSRAEGRGVKVLCARSDEPRVSLGGLQVRTASRPDRECPHRRWGPTVI